MPNVTSALEQLNKQFAFLSEIKNTLEQGNMDAILELFVKGERGKFALHSFLEDNRELLFSIKEHWNKQMSHTGISLEMNNMHLNNSSLNITHRTLGSLGELSLARKSIQLYKSIFYPATSLQLSIERLEKSIVSDASILVTYQLELNAYKEYSAMRKRLKGFTDEKMAMMEQFIENKETQLTKDREELARKKTENETIWEEVLTHYQEVKSFILLFASKGYSHHFHAIDAKKGYIMYHRHKTNHSHAGNFSMEMGHVSMLNEAEWAENTAVEDGNLTRFSFQEKEMERIASALANIPTIQQVHTEEANGEKEIIGTFLNGEIRIASDGHIVTLGEDFNVHHVIRFKEVRDALFLTYKHLKK